MHRFFVSQSNIDVAGRRVVITGDDVNHIKNVLRLKSGEELDACAEDGKIYRCIIESVERELVVCSLSFIKEADCELCCGIYLFQGLPKGDKMDLIVQKAVELGVKEIIPVECARSVVKLDDKKAAKKQERWQQIAKGAAEQAGRAYVPQVKMPVTMKEAAAMASGADVKLIPYEMASSQGHGMDETRAIFSALKPGQDIAVFIGPEGGFEDSEVELCGSSGIEKITLGRRILRTETAGLTVLSWIVLMLEGREEQ
ncbi:MAG: 16S rRNA (uracil(1498)-N(3))-methyltransferase [Lachnospiraceae bacterium]|nr:16S rRNA (uracil(1498)-N(3))-methyltransferase [Lachnospiraceae bacterium]